MKTPLTYDCGKYTNQWQINYKGQLVAHRKHGLLTKILTDEVIAALKDQRDFLTALAEEYEAFYKAELIANQPAPDAPEAIEAFDHEGNKTGMIAHPAWVIYYAALDTMAMASDDVVQLSIARRGKPSPVIEEDVVVNQDDINAYDDALSALSAMNIPIFDHDELREYQERLVDGIKGYMSRKPHLAALSMAETMLTETIEAVRAATSEAAAAEVYAYASIEAYAIEETI